MSDLIYTVTAGWLCGCALYATHMPASFRVYWAVIGFGWIISRVWVIRAARRENIGSDG